jgi:hypothetical protein
MAFEDKKDSESWVVEALYGRAQIVVRGWQVFELQLAHWPRRTRHFVGYEYRSKIPFVSAKIVKFDPDQAIGWDASGQHILLVDASGTASPQEFSDWCTKHQASEVLDVSAEVVELMAVPCWRRK